MKRRFYFILLVLALVLLALPGFAAKALGYGPTYDRQTPLPELLPATA